MISTDIVSLFSKRSTTARQILATIDAAESVRFTGTAAAARGA
jgi:hypothetical protein